MEAFLSFLVSGLQLGVLYGVVTIGYNLLMLVTNVLQFAYAHLVVFSMYMAWVVFSSFKGPIAAGILVAILAGIVVNIAVTFLLLPFIKRQLYLETLVICIAIGMVVVEVLARWFNLGMAISFPASLQLYNKALSLGSISIGYSKITSLVIGLVLVYVFFWYLNRTKQGKKLRAVAQNAEVATFLGISVTKMSIFSFGLGGVVAGVAAVLLAMGVGAASPEMGDNMALLCLSIILLGGVGNLKGGFISALIVGCVTGLALGYLPGDWTMAIAFAVILVVLVFKPSGLFGEQH